MPEFDSHTIISSDSFEKYGMESRRQVSFDRVQDFVDCGLMSRDAVLERYTERLTRNVPNVRGIEIAFQHLKDAGTEHLSSEKTMTAMKNAVVGIIEPPQSSAISELGLDILAWHASFPFPPALGPHSELCDGIDQSSFARAVCLLSMRSVPGYGGRKRWGTWFPANPVHGGYSGNWGPHRGSYVSTRGKGASDFMRRIFRSLASPDHDDPASSHTTAAATEKTETSIPVLRFMYRLWLPEGEKETKDREEDEEPERPEFAIMENEREVSVDIQDVLSECPPEEDRLTMNPFRESYSLVLPGLPHPAHDLNELRVPVSKVSTLLILSKHLGLSERKSGEEEAQSSLEELIDRLSGETGPASLGWEEFQATLRGSEDTIADTLAKMVSLLVETCNEEGKCWLSYK